MKIKRILALAVALTFITVPAYAADIDVSVTGGDMSFEAPSGGGSSSSSYKVELVFNGDEKVTVEGKEQYKVTITGGSKLKEVPDVEVDSGYVFVGWKISGTDDIVDFSLKSFSTRTTFEPVYMTTEEYSKKESKPVEDNSKLIVFTINSNVYTVDSSEFTTDVAPYVDSNSRTMLPVRAVANALSIADEKIVWDAQTQTVTITKEDGGVVSITVGSNVIYVDGQPVTIDTTAVITQDRTFLPLRAVFNALGINDSQISWNDALKQVTVKL